MKKIDVDLLFEKIDSINKLETKSQGVLFVFNNIILCFDTKKKWLTKCSLEKLGLLK